MINCLVVEVYPSEKYESQLGWWNSEYMGKQKSCSKPPTSIQYSTAQLLFFILSWSGQSTVMSWHVGRPSPNRKSRPSGHHFQMESGKASFGNVGVFPWFGIFSVPMPNTKWSFQVYMVWIYVLNIHNIAVVSRYSAGLEFHVHHHWNNGKTN